MTISEVTNRLAMLGYTAQTADITNISFCIQKVTELIRNECNTKEIPEELHTASVDMAVAEFFLAKQTFAPEDLENLDLETAVKQIDLGDATVSFSTGTDSPTSEMLLTAIINHFLAAGKAQYSVFRRFRW
jgi:hypothetical protein